MHPSLASGETVSGGPGYQFLFHSKEWLLVIHVSRVLLPLITTVRVLFLNLKIYRIH